MNLYPLPFYFWQCNEGWETSFIYGVTFDKEYNRTQYIKNCSDKKLTLLRGQIFLRELPSSWIYTVWLAFCFWPRTILSKDQRWDAIISVVSGSHLHISDQGTFGQPCCGTFAVVLDSICLKNKKQKSYTTIMILVIMIVFRIILHTQFMAGYNIFVIIQHLFSIKCHYLMYLPSLSHLFLLQLLTSLWRHKL